jgi:hypothetical protein
LDSEDGIGTNMMWSSSYTNVCMYMSLPTEHTIQTANNSSEKYTNNFLKCKNNNEQALSVQNTSVYFSHSRTKTTFGALRNIADVQWKHKNIQHKKLIQTSERSSCVKYLTRDDANLTSPVGSPLSSFKILFNPLQK